MRVLSLLLAAAFAAGLLVLAGCGGGEETPKPSGEESEEAGDKKEGDSGSGSKGADEGKGGEGDGEEGDGEGDNAGVRKEFKSDEERIWPDHPLARRILTDPHDESKSSSYWINAKEGDWVRFLNWQKNIIIYTVKKREGNILKIDVKQYKRTGEEIPNLDEDGNEKEDVREIKIEGDSQLMRDSVLKNRFVERYVYEWPLYNTDKTLYCERRWVPNPLTGEDNDTCRCWDIRCGGMVYQRRGNTTYVTLIDYGDAEHPPKWDHLDPADMFKYWYMYDRFLHVPFNPQEDPERGEEPERPEDYAPAELVKKLEQIDELVGNKLKAALLENRFEEALESLEQVKAPVAEAVSFAEENNYKPALSQAEVVSGKTEELIEACKAKNSEKALGVLKALRSEVEWFYVSVGRPPDDN
jgi:hypothetical protein